MIFKHMGSTYFVNLSNEALQYPGRGEAMRRRESSTLSNILFSLFIFLFISEVQARKQEQVCSSSCGDIKNITYPFHLKGDPVGCGEPNFELTCESNKTILRSGSGKYYVKEIFYDYQIIRVVDVKLANGSCGALPSRRLSMYETIIKDDRSEKGLIVQSSSYTGRSLSYYTETKFFNCYGNFSPPAYKRVPCLRGNQSYFVKYRDKYWVSDGQESCSVISSVPTLAAIETNPSYETIQKLLQSGFDLLWFDSSCSSFESLLFFRLLAYINWYGWPVRYLEFIRLTIPFYCSNRSFAEYLSFLGRYLIFDLDSWRYDTSTSLLLCFLLAVLTVRLIIAPITLFVYIIHEYKSKWKTVDNVEKFLHNQESWMPKRYSYYEIIAMTNHFRYELGEGGFGSVYKGQLHSGCLIAVKVLKNSKFSAEEFMNEVSTTGRIHHVNIVQLLGYCFEGPKRALVYEYMSNGSLDKHIFSRGGSSKFSWEKLHEIALGTAHGIEYLHGGCDVCILHFDIKPHNILLDHNFTPKVSDFGLAKFYPKENDFVSVSATRGTIGYIAPELISRNFGVVSCKSDVYSFGMLLLEMAGGRRNSFLMETRSSKAYFPSWVYDQIHKGGDLEIHDVSENEIGIARKLCVIGLWCIQVNAADRPSITKVREMLEGSIDDLQMPPKPFFSSSQHSSERDHIQIESDSSTELLLSESMEESMYIDSNV